MLALNSLSVKEKQYWLLFAIAALSFIPTLFFYYVGEEAIFPIISQEMWEHGVWLKQVFFGIDIMHNPLFNWLIIPFSALVGWKHVLIVTRVLTILSTLVTALTLAWAAGRLFQDRTYGIFAALGYVTMIDVLLYHGWLGYVDPNYAMFLFGAIATLWVAVREQHFKMLVLSIVLLTCAFLSKALTAYIYYGVALFVLVFEKQQRNFLLHWRTVPVLLLAYAGPLIWYASIPDGIAQGRRMLAEMGNKFEYPPVIEYVGRLIGFPIDVLVSLGPLTLLAIYLLMRKRYRKEDSATHQLLLYSACWMALLNFLPYWISPHGVMRYLMPIFPLVALIATRIIWQAGEQALVLARKWIIAALILKFAAALVLFPYYQERYRGANYAETARDIVSITEGYPLYSVTPNAHGLSVAGYINHLRYPQPALRWPPVEWHDGFLVAEPEDYAQTGMDKTFKEYTLAAGHNLVLLCRGSACDKANH